MDAIKLDVIEKDRLDDKPQPVADDTIRHDAAPMPEVQSLVRVRVDRQSGVQSVQQS